MNFNGGIIQWSPGQTLEHVEMQVIVAAYSFYGGNKTATANALGIAIRTLDSKLEKYNVDNDSHKKVLDDESERQREFLKRQRGPLTPNYLVTNDSIAARAEQESVERAVANDRTPTEAEMHGIGADAIRAEAAKMGAKSAEGATSSGAAKAGLRVEPAPKHTKK